MDKTRLTVKQKHIVININNEHATNGPNQDTRYTIVSANCKYSYVYRGGATFAVLGLLLCL
jgi:hypothetical protein